MACGDAGDGEHRICQVTGTCRNCAVLRKAGWPFAPQKLGVITHPGRQRGKIYKGGGKTYRRKRGASVLWRQRPNSRVRRDVVASIAVSRDLASQCPCMPRDDEEPAMGRPSARRPESATGGVNHVMAGGMEGRRLIRRPSRVLGHTCGNVSPAPKRGPGRRLGRGLRVKTNPAGERLILGMQRSTWPKHRSPGAGENEERSTTHPRITRGLTVREWTREPMEADLPLPDPLTI